VNCKGERGSGLEKKILPRRISIIHSGSREEFGAEKQGKGGEGLKGKQEKWNHEFLPKSRTLRTNRGKGETDKLRGTEVGGGTQEEEEGIWKQDRKKRDKGKIDQGGGEAALLGGGKRTKRWGRGAV